MSNRIYRRYEKKTPTKTIKYVYSNENILEEIQTQGNTTTKKEYINGLGTDDVIAVDQLEPNLTIQERGELNFCNERVTPYATEFAQYGYTNITNRCNELGGSGAILVTNRYYFHKDNLGSIVGITDNSGTTVTTYDYDSYGNPHIASGVDIGNERLYTGREYDEETGLYFNRARYYNPKLGRFISQDPIGQVDDVNLYAYVGNNPIMYTDRSGLEKILISIYSDRGDGGWSSGHSWIELEYKGEKHSYSVYPFIGVVNDDRELKGKGVKYKNYIFETTEISKEDYNYLVDEINKNIDDNISWLSQGFCTGWAISKWNSVIEDSYKIDFNFLPNSLANQFKKNQENFIY